MLAYAADFETTTDADDCRVWAWGIAQVGFKNTFKYGNTIDSFFDYLSKLPPCRVYFHNLAFDGSFIFDYLLNNGWVFVEDRKDLKRKHTFSAVISDMNQVYSITLVFPHGVKIDIFDSYKIIPMSIAAVAKTFGMAMSKGDIDYTEYRKVGHELTEEELDYLKRDVLILSTALDTMLTMGETKMTAGSNALADYKRMCGGNKGFRRQFPVLDDDVDAFIRQAYRGGWTYANPRYVGREINYMTSWDVNSLYPSIMYGCHGEVMPYGQPVWFDGEPQPSDEFPLWIAQVVLEFTIKDGHYPSHQFRKSLDFLAKDYVLDSKGEQVVTLTNVDFDLLCEQYDVKVYQWLGGYKFRAYKYLFRDYIDKWTEVKIKAGREGNGGMRQIAKLHLNSLYCMREVCNATRGPQPLPCACRRCCALP